MLPIIKKSSRLSCAISKYVAYGKSIRSSSAAFTKFECKQGISKIKTYDNCDTPTFTKYYGDCFAKDPIHIRGRKFLPGSTSDQMPNVLKSSPKPYLTTFTWSSKNTNLEESGAEIGHLVKTLLPKYSAILFKNLPFQTASDVGELVSAAGLEPMLYTGGSGLRTALDGDVYLASEEDSRVTIEFHNEMSYLKNYPRKVK